jgi:hypothetical protein
MKMKAKPKQETAGHKTISFFRRQAYGPGLSKRRKQLITVRLRSSSSDSGQAEADYAGAGRCIIPESVINEHAAWTPRTETLLETIRNLNKDRLALGGDYPILLRKLLLLLP